MSKKDSQEWLRHLRNEQRKDDIAIIILIIVFFIIPFLI
ncbi:hypothetical protein OIBDGNHJ_00043 [Campylobacter phage PC22]|nr:hypothetical protein OIBDGNHJ_00043 [Campylobacter phage PC22]WAK44780.1 hypothetical protein GEEDAMGG_00015 [Campylobacter phage PC11]